jgi:hypothetical protein
MASDGLPVERLRQYLCDLKPEARVLLIAELERGLLRGDETPGTDLVLQELRRTMRGTGQSPPRIGNPARLFFNPIEPFLVDDDLAHKHPGRIPRVALESIWAWLCRDIAAEEAKAFSEDVSQALLSYDTARAELATRAFQDQIIQSLQNTFTAVSDNDKARRQLAGQIGIPGGLEIATQVLGILQSRDELAALGARLPGHMNVLSDAHLDTAKIVLDATAGKNPEMLLHALLLVMGRLSTPWQLIRLATKAAESDNAARIAASPYAMAVTIVLADVERLVRELKADLKSGRGVAVIALLKTIHDAARGLRTELDLSGDSQWGRQLAAIRSEISNLLKSEIESMPGRVRRLLRPRPVKEIAPNSALDYGDVAETEALIGFAEACRKYASELAINEVTQRTHTELQRYLETSTRAMLDGLRNAGEADRRFRQSQFDAAVSFCAKVFGSDYAAMLTKAGSIAANSERKAARA